ncbi:MAG: glycerol-3-phosphate 1-O-acyltransferase PlsB [Pseudomonadota bacterium]
MASIRQRLYSMMARTLKLWVKPDVASDDSVAAIRRLHADPSVRVCYVLETGGLADFLTLESVAQTLELPRASDALDYAGQDLGRSVVILRRMRGWLFQRKSARQSVRLRRLIDAATTARDASDMTVDALPVYLIPVGIYWGKAPGKARSWFSLLFREDWEVAGRTRRFLTTLLHGRHTLLQFSEPMQLAPLLQEQLDSERSFRKASRVLRVHFRMRREATVGPDLSHRRTLIGEVLRAESVRKLIAAEGEPNSRARTKATNKARKYAYEIAADLSYSTVRLLDRVLSWLWNRIYDGIEINGIERLRQTAVGNEIIYVPCHRSHFDYLLLSYVLYKQGLSLPYVAAGINLNIPVVGTVLRRGGAFFLRRTFSGNRLYAAVFHSYLKALQTRGYPLEYFIEGGRSRTGRLLAPKVGMINMTVRAFAQDSRKPVKFVPVYFGYEKLIEGTAFIGELRGGEKSKESLFGFFRSLRALREQFGKVYVNIGEPIDLADTLQQAAPDWRETDTADSKPEWLPAVADQLGWEILERINSAAAVTPVSLLALALLGTQRQAMAEDDLLRQLKLYQALYAETPYSDTVTLPSMSPEEILAHGDRLGVIEFEEHALGRIVHLPTGQAQLLTYFRNNILHLTVLHSTIAACFIHGKILARSELQRLVRLIAPFIRAEMRLRWEVEDFPRVVDIVIDAMCRHGLLEVDGDMLRRPNAGSALAFSLNQMGQSVVPVLQRYYMTIALLNKYGSGALSQGRLEEICQLSAERLSILYGMRSPDFFDRRLFRTFLGVLRERQVIAIDDDGNLAFELKFDAIENDARLVLGEPLRHSILTVTEVTREEKIQRPPEQEAAE